MQGYYVNLAAKRLHASQQVFDILAEQGGSALVGKATALSEGTFWQNDTLSKTSRAKSIQ